MAEFLAKVVDALTDAQAWVAANIPWIGEYLAVAFGWIIDLF